MTDERTVVMRPASGSCAQAATEADPPGIAGSGHLRRGIGSPQACGAALSWLGVMITPNALGMDQARILLHERRSRARCR
jgi:hypothetical protein